eukprot:scaffold6533_cov117-Isochrysis_galbana.AAC.2
MLRVVDICWRRGAAPGLERARGGEHACVTMAVSDTRRGARGCGAALPKGRAPTHLRTDAQGG